MQCMIYINWVGCAPMSALQPPLYILHSTTSYSGLQFTLKQLYVVNDHIQGIIPCFIAHICAIRGTSESSVYSDIYCTVKQYAVLSVVVMDRQQYAISCFMANICAIRGTSVSIALHNVEARQDPAKRHRRNPCKS